MTTAVYCEAAHLHGLELIAAARRFSQRVKALCEDAAHAQACRAAGADEVIGIPMAEDDCAQGTMAAQIIGQLDPDSVLFPATVRGRLLSAWVAAKLETGLTADCTSLGVTPDGLLLQSRPAFGGNLTADILCRQRRPQMASVRPGIYPMPELPIKELCKGMDAAPVRCMEGRRAREYMTRAGFEPARSTVSLQEARIIVAGGKGVGSKRGFEKLFQLAGLLGGAVGATRSAVDAGYIGYAHQIGQTGVAVRAELYIAFGISGAIQHTVGMNSSRTVIAVNRDRLAPIFRCADVGIAGDWEETADAMIASLERKSGSAPALGRG